MMELYVVYSLALPHRGDSNEYIQNYFIDDRKDIP